MRVDLLASSRCRSSGVSGGSGLPLRVDGRPVGRVGSSRSCCVRDLGVESGEPLVGVVPVDVADRDDVLGREVDEVGAAHAADADGRDVERVARRGEAAAEDVPRHDRKAGRCRSDLVTNRVQSAIVVSR